MPWAGQTQVEHDLALARAVVELFSEPTLARALAFRGGTAIHRLVLPGPQRFSEDLDLVQVDPGPIGELMRAVRRRLDPLLGRSRFSNSSISHTATYRFESEIPPTRRLTLKIEINTREHFSVLGWQRRSFSVHSPWFEGRTEVQTYALDELCGTKMRALYQRRKGRDLYERNLRAKAKRPDFRGDIQPLLAPDARYDPDAALDLVVAQLVSRLPGP